MDQDTIYKVALSKATKIGPVLAKNLLMHFGTAEDIMKAKPHDLMQVDGVGSILSKAIEFGTAIEAAKVEIENCEKLGIDVLFFSDDAYPRRLRHHDSCPIVLYYKGSHTLNPDRSIGIVGTRNPSEMGKIQTEKLVEGAAPLNTVIVSGLAFGIDSIAHKKAVELHIPTIGVLGHGLNLIYPSEHRQLAGKMLEHGGLLTEFGTDSKPDKQNFPMRNRIIAALSDAVVVAESKVKGGSIITAEFANEYNKDVFAFPGRPHEEISAGCNGLIKKNKAHLIDSIDDVKYVMRWEDVDKSKVIQATLFAELAGDEQTVVDIIKQHKELTIDELSAKTGLTPSIMANTLLQLEFKGVVRPLPGKRYMLNQ